MRSTGLRRAIYVLAAAWAVLAWLLWPLLPHSGYYTALLCALLIAPAYLFLTIERSKGGMRTFAGAALGLLTFSGIFPALSPGYLVYALVPPGAAVAAAALRREQLAPQQTKPALSLSVQYAMAAVVAAVSLSLFVVLYTEGNWVSILSVFHAFGL